MYVIGITGGVGSGKSAALSYLSHEYAAQVLQLDQAAHYLMRPDQTCYQPLVELLGSAILAADGSIDRRQMGDLVFGRPELVGRVNRIVHPRVKEYARAEIAKARQGGEVRYFVIEAALLIEDHYDEICDELWYIHTEISVRQRRLAANRGYTRQKTESIMKNQLSEEQFRAHCQWVIDNSSEDLERMYKQIDEGLRRL